MEHGEASDSQRSVPSSSKYPEIEIDPVLKHSTFKKQGWCKVIRNPDACCATLQNKSSSVICVDGTDVPSEKTIMVRCGSEIIPGPVLEENPSKDEPMKESSNKVYEIMLDTELVKCCVCLSFWCKAVKLAPCLHNFCNSCFSQWMITLKQKGSRVICPHCRSAVHLVQRDHFLDSIEQEIMKRGFMLRCHKEISGLKSHAKKKSHIISVAAKYTECRICLNVWNDVVKAVPCFHNFCNGCFSECLRRSQQQSTSVLCPECSVAVEFVGRDHFLHQIEEQILKSHPTLRRSNQELAVLKSDELIKEPLVIHTGNNRGRKRSHSEEIEDIRFACAQCGTEYRGFQCNQSTVHLQCYACGGMMPSRTDIRIAQHCLGCDQAFCGAYWEAQEVTGRNSYPICAPETFKPIAERFVTRFPYRTHEGNRHEQEITGRCIQQMGKTLQIVVSEWITKLDNQEIDHDILVLNHWDMITSETHLCNECFDRLVSFLLYRYRISLPKHYLPEDAMHREDCWYGHNCRAQHRDEDHARKKNHVCRPTRGSD